MSVGQSAQHARPACYRAIDKASGLQEVRDAHTLVNIGDAT
jgi:hypothetical protein